MALPSSLTLASVPFTKVAEGSYINDVATFEQTNHLLLDYTFDSKGVNRYKFERRLGVISPLAGGPDKLVRVYTVIEVPLDYGVTSSAIMPLYNQTAALIQTAGYMDKFLRGER